MCETSYSSLLPVGSWKIGNFPQNSLEFVTIINNDSKPLAHQIFRISRRVATLSFGVALNVCIQSLNCKIDWTWIIHYSFLLLYNINIFFSLELNPYSHMKCLFAIIQLHTYDIVISQYID